MIFSMTGFGSSRGQVGNMEVSVQVESINGKHLDIRLSVPELCAAKVLQWKKDLGSQLKRGSIRLSIACTIATSPTNVSEATREQIKAVYQELSSIANEVGATTDLFRYALNLAQVEGRETPKELSEEELEKVGGLVAIATQHCIESRQQEGANLQQQLHDCIEQLLIFVKEVEEYAENREEHLRQKLEERIKVRENTVDLNRWEQEVLYYLEKMDISEEEVRLKSHLAYFSTTMQVGGSVGKKLGFITQEIGREINTIGSKAQNANLQHIVVNMKEVQEQLKEQLYNIL